MTSIWEGFVLGRKTTSLLGAVAVALVSLHSGVNPATAAVAVPAPVLSCVMDFTSLAANPDADPLAAAQISPALELLHEYAVVAAAGKVLSTNSVMSPSMRDVVLGDNVREAMWKGKELSERLLATGVAPTAGFLATPGCAAVEQLASTADTEAAERAFLSIVADSMERQSKPELLAVAPDNPPQNVEAERTPSLDMVKVRAGQTAAIQKYLGTDQLPVSGRSIDQEHCAIELDDRPDAEPGKSMTAEQVAETAEFNQVAAKSKKAALGVLLGGGLSDAKFLDTLNVYIDSSHMERALSNTTALAGQEIPDRFGGEDCAQVETIYAAATPAERLAAFEDLAPTILGELQALSARDAGDDLSTGTAWASAYVKTIEGRAPWNNLAAVDTAAAIGASAPSADTGISWLQSQAQPTVLRRQGLTVNSGSKTLQP